MQHKTQLGGNRFITKVRVFKPDGATLPILIFYVDPNPAPDNLASRDTATRATFGQSRKELWNDPESWRMIGRGADGKSVIREHVIWEKLEEDFLSNVA